MYWQSPSIHASIQPSSDPYTVSTRESVHPLIASIRNKRAGKIGLYPAGPACVNDCIHGVYIQKSAFEYVCTCVYTPFEFFPLSRFLLTISRINTKMDPDSIHSRGNSLLFWPIKQGF